MTSPDLYDTQHEGLVHVHRLISGALGEVADGAPIEALVARARGAGQFVLAHHHVEDTVLFPGLRELGSGAAAFLDERDREHRVIQRLAERLVTGAAAPHPLGTELIALGTELNRALSAHVELEEAGLSARNLRRIITLPRLTELVARLEAARTSAAAILNR